MRMLWLLGLSFEKATLVWDLGGGDSSVAYVADSGRRVGIWVWRKGELAERGYISGDKGWLVDMEVMEFSAQEEHFKKPLELLNYWATGDPMAEAVVLERPAKFQRVGEEEVAGKRCEVWAVKGEDSTEEVKVWRWEGLTLRWLERSEEGEREVKVRRLQLGETDESKIGLPEGVYPHR